MRGESLLVSLLVFTNILNTLEASQDEDLTKTILARLDELEEKLRQRDNDIEALEKKLKARDGSFTIDQCAYKEYWGSIAGTPDDAIITYDSVYFSDVYGYVSSLNVGMNTTSGVFTAPEVYPGYTEPSSYTVTYSMQFYGDDSHPAGYVYLHKNGERINESMLTSGNGRDMASRTLMLEMRPGDTLYLYCSMCYEVLYTNICIIH